MCSFCSLRFVLQLSRDKLHRDWSWLLLCEIPRLRVSDWNEENDCDWKCYVLFNLWGFEHTYVAGFFLLIIEQWCAIFRRRCPSDYVHSFGAVDPILNVLSNTFVSLLNVTLIFNYIEVCFYMQKNNLGFKIFGITFFRNFIFHLQTW